jgi:hypothetical protein
LPVETASAMEYLFAWELIGAGISRHLSESGQTGPSLLMMTTYKLLDATLPGDVTS